MRGSLVLVSVLASFGMGCNFDPGLEDWPREIGPAKSAPIASNSPWRWPAPMPAATTSAVVTPTASPKRMAVRSPA